MKRSTLFSFALLCMATVASAADHPPVDHAGSNLTLADGDRIWGVHTNIGTFTIGPGFSASIREYDPLVASTGYVRIEANQIVIHGTLDATGAGHDGGGGGGGGGGDAIHTSGGSALAGEGGAGGSSQGDGAWGLDGASGVSGGAGGNGGSGGGAYAGIGGSGGALSVAPRGADGASGGYMATGSNGDSTTDESLAMGSGGGGGGGGIGGSVTAYEPYEAAGGGGGGGAGGPGGGYIQLLASGAITIDGEVLARGSCGVHGENGTWGASNDLSAVGGKGGDGGSAATMGTGDGGLHGGGCENGGLGGDGGAGAGGGILLSAPDVNVQDAVLDARGGNSSILSGGTIKIFFSGPNTLSQAFIRAGRIFARSGATVIDVQPPYYPGPAGIKTATLVSGTKDTILLSWNAAMDDFTAAGNIRYDLYMAGDPGSVFTSTPVMTRTGYTHGYINGLPLQGDPVFFGICAYDEVDNREMNGVVIQGPTLGQKIDTLPPTYPTDKGVISATLVPATPYHVRVEWNQAVDNLTPEELIVYEIYASTNPTSVFSGAPIDSITGETFGVLTSLPVVNRVYYFGVRAKDEYDNRELNHVIVEGPLVGVRSDTEPPTYPGAAGVISAELMPASREEVLIKWNQAVDNVTPADRIIYGIYASTDPGAVFAGEPIEFVTGQTEAVIESLVEPGATYYIGVRARDEQGNRELNTVIVTGPMIHNPDDSDPPYYPYDEGVISATLFPIGDNWVLVTWNVAVDNRTAPENIVYEVYASTNIDTVFNGVPVTTMTGATETVVDSLPAVGQVYYFGVRAKDEHGNREMNLKRVEGPRL